MTKRVGRTRRLPVVDEQARISKRKVETGRVRISTRLRERQQPIRPELLQEDVVVTRVKVGRCVETEPSIREEGGVLVVPVFEEVLVKRVLLHEELHIVRKRRVEETKDVVTLRSQDVAV